jgi:DNA replication factor GINS
MLELTGLLELMGLLGIRVIERDYEEEEVKVAYIGPPTSIFVEDDFIELVKGAEYTLPRWLAKLLSEKGVARIQEAPVEESVVARLQFNESRSRGQLKFEKLQGYFYSRIRDQVSSMFRSYKEINDLTKAHQVLQSITKLSTATRDLYKTRLIKILNIVTSEIGPDVLANLSEEEKQLYSALRTILGLYNSMVFEVEKHG